MTEYEGRVEVCINKVWGTICGYRWWSWYSGWQSWEAVDSNVVCKQVGHMEIGM